MKFSILKIIFVTTIIQHYRTIIKIIMRQLIKKNNLLSYVLQVRKLLKTKKKMDMYVI